MNITNIIVLNSFKHIQTSFCFTQNDFLSPPVRCQNTQSYSEDMFFCKSNAFPCFPILFISLFIVFPGAVTGLFSYKSALKETAAMAA